MPRPLLLRCRRAVTLLELLVVLVLLGLSWAVVLPALRLPAPAALESALVRARALAVHRGEAVRLETSPDGRWQVVATADTERSVLLAGSPSDGAAAAPMPSVVISALGNCLPEGPWAPGAGAWDPVRCVVTPPLIVGNR